LFDGEEPPKSLLALKNDVVGAVDDESTGADIGGEDNGGEDNGGEDNDDLPRLASSRW
jgi:hypothetical protein